jgi:SpoVK/Ycf46/Vps4 family AAA+-type ATPase
VRTEVRELIVSLLVMQGIFAAARAAAPSMIFIDELDALAPARSSGHGGPGTPADQMAGRIVSALLNAMDTSTGVVQQSYFLSN